MEGSVLADCLRRCVLDAPSIAAVARASGVPQATLQEFAVGKPNGTFADLRLSSAQKLFDYFGLHVEVQSGDNRKGRKRMLLKNELIACDCEDSPDKFRERLIDALVSSFPDTTIDGLVCNPSESLKYCKHIREQVGSESMFDAVILKTLINIRKTNECPTGLRSKGRRRNLASALREVGCDWAADEFRDLTLDCLSGMYRDITIDELVCQPREAMMLCNFVRRRSGCQELADELILGTLMNVRKAS